MGPYKNRPLTPEEARTLMEAGPRLTRLAMAATGVSLRDVISRPDPRALDPRCDAAVRRFLGLHETLGGDTPLQVYEEGPWGPPWASRAPPP
jgi:hypothetical protein